ncbi:MAG: NAD(P)H-hydrate dehydratase [Neomegalonema sp.]|nr:NAD(P)H-hydrate dehydratase [Neomegalonema sp.]
MAKKAADAETLSGDKLIHSADVAAIDARAALLGTSGEVLMARAGQAVASMAEAMLAGAAGAVVVLAGPGANGGDGYVAAARLREAGWAVRIVAPMPAKAADAVASASVWRSMGGEILPWGEAARAALKEPALIIDSLFGVGLTRPLTEEWAEIVDAANQSVAPILSVDVPSGVSADDGAIRGPAIQAQRTVTFVAKKPCHVLAPGAFNCGDVTCVDILSGCQDARGVVGETAVEATAEGLRARLAKRVDAHKYEHGAVLVATGGMGATGAARLAATAALRVGAGVATLAAPGAAMLECATAITALMLRRAESDTEFAALLADKRVTAAVIGPGHAAHPDGAERTRAFVKAALAAPSAALVLDADALTAFAAEPGQLFAAIAACPAPVVLTPHRGEFARLFPDLTTETSKLRATRAAAVRSGAVVLFKGPDTVIAAPDGPTAVASAIGPRAAPWLATAGAGDVLSGLIAGLAARGWPPFAAACDGAVLHQEAGRSCGAGLIAEDLPGAVAAWMRKDVG